jgi:hypothetical protein
VDWVADQRIDDAEYLVVPNGCSCSWVAPANATSRDGLVYANDVSGYNFAVGRKNLTNGRVAISKVQVPGFTQWYQHQGGYEVADAASEMLVCETPYAEPAKPVIPFPTKSCGAFAFF